jgi:hypothetical protein
MRGNLGLCWRAECEMAHTTIIAFWAHGLFAQWALSECPLLAHSGHPWLHRICPLLGVKRTLCLHRMCPFDTQIGRGADAGCTVEAGP